MQPDPTPNEHSSIHDIVQEDLEQTVNPTPWRQRVIDELASRKQRGLETYGTVLQPGNGRDAAQDAFEEALDTVVYLKQLELEAVASGDYQDQFYAGTLYGAAAALCTRLASPTSCTGGKPVSERYRWLTVGDRYTYVARPGKGDDSRRGTVCKVLTVPRTGGGPGNARVLFDDGHVTIVPAGVLRRAE